MATPIPSLVETRLANVERQLEEIRARLTAIERLLANPGEHPIDQTTVRKKVTYDWQA
ncbi:MAG TPA: hypothetical protein VGS23_05045 [Thermoplasmata archaeon]|nr:hypothetical protein [Thermoplasmata archaeon]